MHGTFPTDLDELRRGAREVEDLGEASYTPAIPEAKPRTLECTPIPIVIRSRAAGATAPLYVDGDAPAAAGASAFNICGALRLAYNCAASNTAMQKPAHASPMTRPAAMSDG